MSHRDLLALLTVGTAAAFIVAFGHIVTADGLDWLDAGMILLHAVLTLWLVHGLWLAIAGFCVVASRRLRERFGDQRAAEPLHVRRQRRSTSSARTAITIPVYNEDAVRVFSGIRAMLESIDATGHGDEFDIFVLSDTRDGDLWLREEAEWAALRAVDSPRARLFYRRRLRNVGRKSGNIKDFLERWGGNYEYMIVFDADSIMSGETLVELVRRMNDAPGVGLIQVPPQPTRGETLFARLQEFACSVYGPLCSAGLSWLARGDGNFWGHNAIIRVRAFVENCDLPHLPGRAPLGGEILSHDFVEAALMRRAGWELRMADDLGGSWEETPPTIIDFAKRDRRWCQGNLQHFRLLFARFMHPSSRYYFGTGVMAYASSLAWMSFLLVGGYEIVRRSLTEPVYFQGDSSQPIWPVSVEHEAVALLTLTLCVLFVPKILGLILVLIDPHRRRAQGGAIRVTLSVLIESIYSALIAPVMMMFHASFVLSVLIGGSVGWGTQRRGVGGTALGEAIQAHWLHTLIGVVAGVGVYVLAPDVFWWTLPIVLGLVLSIPLTLLSSSTRIGLALRRAGFLLAEEEGAPSPVLARLEHILRQREKQSQEPMDFPRAIADERMASIHAGLVRAYGEEADVDPTALEAIESKLRSEGPGALTGQERVTILQNAGAFEQLHRSWAEAVAKMKPAASLDPAA